MTPILERTAARLSDISRRWSRRFPRIPGFGTSQGGVEEASNFPRANSKPNHEFRTIWLSDVHLGTPESKAIELLDFLRHHESETLYLVGDIFDGWRLKKSVHWPQAHNDVVQKILRKARKGTKVIYVPGNHDEAMRSYCGMSFGGVQIERSVIHLTADRRRLWVTHGDWADGLIKYSRLLTWLGDWSYRIVLALNTYFNRLNRRLGRPYWSLSGYIKSKVKNAKTHIERFREAMMLATRKRGLDGVVCGHIHDPDIRHEQGVSYFNDGDWVEHCTALVEHHDGSLAIIHWTPEQWSWVAIEAERDLTLVTEEGLVT